MALRKVFPTHRSDRGGLDDLCCRHLLLVSAATFGVLNMPEKRWLIHSPGDVNPDAGSMNYAIVVMAGVWIFAVSYWYIPKIGGKTFFTGPLTHDWDAEAVAISIGVVADERDKKTDGAATPVKVQPVETLDD